MTDLAVKIYVRGKILDFLRKTMLGLELTEKAKTGVEKMETLLDGIWDKIEKFIEEEKRRNLEWMPDIIENFAEDLISRAIKEAKELLDIRKLAQEIFNLERAAKVL
jgi:hypothetical protein